MWARVPNSGAYDVDRAAKAAKKAFPAWAALSYEARAEFMMKVQNHISTITSSMMSWIL